MIQEDIINELQYIPETKLAELYDIIHCFRLQFNAESRKPQTLAGSLKSYASEYIPHEQAIQQAWQAVVNEK